MKEKELTYPERVGKELDEIVKHYHEVFQSPDDCQLNISLFQKEGVIKVSSTAYVEGAELRVCRSKYFLHPEVDREMPNKPELMFKQ